MDAAAKYFPRVARVAELADAPDLGSGGVIRGGSSPLSRTSFAQNRTFFGSIVYKPNVIAQASAMSICFFSCPAPHVSV